MRLSRATIPLASEDRTHGQAKSPSSHYNLAPHFWPGFINLQHFCHSRWRNPVRLSKSGKRRGGERTEEGREKGGGEEDARRMAGAHPAITAIPARSRRNSGEACG